MSCFSTVKIDPAWLPAEMKNVGAWQTKDLPEDAEKLFPYDNYYDGAVLRDGVFVREDGMWNPSLTGWVELVSDLGFAHYEVCVRFERGVLTELIAGDEPPGDHPTVERGWISKDEDVLCP